MRLDPHLPKLYPRAHADVGACHKRRYAYGCDLILPRFGQGSFWRLKILKVDASDKAGFSGCIAAIVPARDEAELIGPVVTSLLNQCVARPVLLVDDESTDGTADVARRAAEKKARPMRLS
jgi:Glycosyl transferase family 2